MKQKFRVYCAHPITGLTWDEVTGYYTSIKDTLEDMGFEAAFVVSL